MNIKCGSMLNNDVQNFKNLHNNVQQKPSESWGMFLELFFSATVSVVGKNDFLH